MRTIMNLLDAGAEKPPWAAVEGATVVRSMKDTTASGWRPVPELFGHRWPSTLEVVVGSALSKGGAASALACRAYSRPYGRHESTEQGDEMAYWRGWTADVALFCRRCNHCNRYRRGPGARQGELQQATSEGPLTKIHVDLTGPSRSLKDGFVYLLTAIDYFIKYFIFCPDSR